MRAASVIGPDAHRVTVPARAAGRHGVTRRWRSARQ